MMVNIVLQCCLLLLSLSGGNAKNYILDISVKCGTTRGNNPVVNILTDVAISARARCYGGDKTFTSKDKVHYTLPGILTSAKSSKCRWHKRTGSNTYAVDVLVRYGEVGSLILTKDKIRTVVCTYDQYGKDASPSHNVLDNFIAPRELGTIVGSTVPSSQLKLSIQDVHNADVKGDMNIDRKYTIYGRYTGPIKVVSLKPVHCDAVSSSGKRYAILRAGCGDGLVFRKQDGFVTSGKTFRSPYFEGYHLDDSKILSVECNVTLCNNCAGSSCATVCNGPPGYTVTNGRRSSCVGNYKYGSVCTYICNTGYNKLFPGLSTCGPDGMWTVPRITCAAKNCGTAPGIRNGARTAVRTYFPNVATYRCNPGYNMRGSSRVGCLSTGKWAARPTCIIKNCGTPPNLLNGSRKYKSTTYGSVAVYGCKYAYRIVGSRNVACLSTGKWGKLPRCGRISCGTPPGIRNGRRTFSLTYFPYSAAYYCNTGYTRKGSSRVQCLLTNKWSARPTCIIKNCGTPPNLLNGSRKYKLTTYGSVAVYGCKYAYRIVGSRNVKCLSTGKWGKLPRCGRISCGTPPGISNGRRSFSRTYFPYSATYYCNTGYARKGSSRVQCLLTNKWSKRPTCTIRNCGTPPNLANGARTFKTTTYRSVATYGCKYAFRISGNRKVSCLSNGKWGKLPRCGRIYCGTPPGIRNGSRTAKLTYFPNAAIYKCNVGYAMKGSARVQCLVTNKWAKRPTCNFTTKKCPTPKVFGAARFVRKTGNRENDIIQYGCNNGKKPRFPKSNPTGIVVCRNGVFPGIRFSC